MAQLWRTQTVLQFALLVEAADFEIFDDGIGLMGRRAHLRTHFVGGEYRLQPETEPCQQRQQGDREELAGPVLHGRSVMALIR
ncbi:hypothetical protein SDC9_190600 [bioreactor metagenome]|uniref:Uncharacterized protein n=1 Tax=bioreactor metagenome TaxID=1076179 RepID=A0A645HVF4_9ZZZZ